MNRFLSATFTMLCIFTGTTFADELYKLTLQDAPLIIRKGDSVTKRIIGIPRATSGRIELDIKWHAVSFIPFTFNRLKIELLHGSRVLVTNDGYAMHSGKQPGASYLNIGIDNTEAHASGDFALRVTNNSDDDAAGFNIQKEITDINPFIHDIESNFRLYCNIEPAFLITKKDSLSGIDIGKNSTVEVEVHVPGTAHRAGKLHLKAKWHGFSLNPAVSSFHPLRVEVLYKGSVLKSDEGYSIHSNEKGKTNKLDMIIDLPYEDYTEERLKLRIINEGPAITGFDIQKHLDFNPLVQDFKSMFTPCH